MTDPLYAFDEQLLAGLAGLPADGWIASARLQWADMPADEDTADGSESAELPVEETGSFFGAMSADISGPLLTVDTPLTDFDIPESTSSDLMAGMEWLAEANAAYNSVFGDGFASVESSIGTVIADLYDTVGGSDALNAFVSDITGDPLFTSDPGADSGDDVLSFHDTASETIFGDVMHTSQSVVSEHEGPVEAGTGIFGLLFDDVTGDALLAPDTPPVSDPPGDPGDTGDPGDIWTSALADPDPIPYPTTNLTSDYLEYLASLSAAEDGCDATQGTSAAFAPLVQWDAVTLADPDMPL